MDGVESWSDYERALEEATNNNNDNNNNDENEDETRIAIRLYGSSTQKKRQRFPEAKATASSMRRCDRIPQTVGYCPFFFSRAVKEA